MDGNWLLKFFRGDKATDDSRVPSYKVERQEREMRELEARLARLGIQVTVRER